MQGFLIERSCSTTETCSDLPPHLHLHVDPVLEARCSELLEGPLPPVAEEGEEHAQPRPASLLLITGKRSGYIRASPRLLIGVGFVLSGFLGRSGLVRWKAFVFLQGKVPAFSSLSGTLLPEPALTASLSCLPPSLWQLRGPASGLSKGPGAWEGLSWPPHRDKPLFF